MKKTISSALFVFVTAVLLSLSGMTAYAAGAVTSVVIKNMPAKTDYYVGNYLNTSGLSLRATFDDGTTQEITSGFTCTPKTFTEDGEQNVTVSYGGKTATYKVNVTIQPTVVKQPKSVTTDCSKIASFTYEVRSKDVTYQWYIRKKGASGWTLWKGHTTSTTTATPNTSWDGMQLYCEAADAYGNSFTSDTVKVTLTDVLKITGASANGSVYLNQAATMSIQATGKNLTYQWYYKKKGASGWTLWKNHTSATTDATVNDSWNGMKVYCVVKDKSGKSLSSEPATITIGAAASNLVITQQPQSVTVKAGNALRFAVAANGSELKCEWYYKKSGAASWSLWKNGGGTVYTDRAIFIKDSTVNTTWNGRKIYCAVRDSSGEELGSDVVWVSIIQDN